MKILNKEKTRMVLEGRLIENMFRSFKGKILFFEDQLIIAVGDCDCKLSGDEIVHIDRRNFRIYYNEIEAFGFSVKKSDEILLKMEANGVKSTFLLYGNVHQDDIRKRLQMGVLGQFSE